MKPIFILALVVLAVPANAQAASIVNNDTEARTIVVVEGGNQREIVVDPGETVAFCNSGCFVTLPNGDREALAGSESIEIKDGVARLR